MILPKEHGPLSMTLSSQRARNRGNADDRKHRAKGKTLLVIGNHLLPLTAALPSPAQDITAGSGRSDIWAPQYPVQADRLSTFIWTCRPASPELGRSCRARNLHGDLLAFRTIIPVPVVGAEPSLFRLDC